MDFKIEQVESASKNIKLDIKVCKHCFGRGKLSFIQSAIIDNNESVRVNDKAIRCEYCKGSGVVINKNTTK